MNWLVGVYIAATVFGAGITLIDLLGFVGHGVGHDSGGHGADHDAGGHGADHDAGHDATHDGGGHGADHAGHAQLQENSGSPQASLVAHDPRPPRVELGLRALSTARTLVYFTFGFGPLGWIASAFGASPATSLFWSIPTGVLFAAVGLALRRLQRTVLDSQVREEELLEEAAEIVVPIEPARVGKVRVLVGGRYVERYARAEDPLASIARGTRVRVVGIGEDVFIVSED
jgi:membrane protein implicated in regulation of membrane protease activity